MSKNRNLNLRISSYSYKCVYDINDSSKKQYKSLVKKLGKMVLKNGLIQTLVFLHSKGKKEYNILINHIAKWWELSPRLKKYEFIIERGKIRKENKQIIEKVTGFSSSEYKRFTMETLKLSIWLVRFADGMIEDEV